MSQAGLHPTPIYDMVILLAIFAFLWRLRKGDHPRGFLFALYLVMLGVGRFVTEFYRTTPEVALGLTTAQWLSLAAVLIGIGLAVTRRRRALSPA